MAYLRSTAGEPFANRRRFEAAKLVVALSLVLLLMFAGLRGRQQAQMQARLNDVTAARNQLQQRLEEVQKPPDALTGNARGTSTSTSGPPASNLPLPALVNALKARLDQFGSVFSPEELSEAGRLELRLSQAVLANAERQFTGALTIITKRDEQERKSTGADAQTDRFVRVLRVRGDAFYGLHQWRDALDCYQQVLVLRPHRLTTAARVAECRAALGQTNEAAALP